MTKLAAHGQSGGADDGADSQRRCICWDEKQRKPAINVVNDMIVAHGHQTTNLRKQNMLNAKHSMSWWYYGHLLRMLTSTASGRN